MDRELLKSLPTKLCSAISTGWTPIFTRAKFICLNPRAGWAELSSDRASTKNLFFGYILPLAAIGPACQYLRMISLGETTSKGAKYHWHLIHGLASSSLTYVVFLLSIIVTIFAAKLLASRFGGSLNFGDASKLIGYSLTPVFLGGFLTIIPKLSMLAALVGLYGLYLFWEGVPVFSGVTEEKRPKFISSVLGGSFVLMIILSLILRAMVR